MIAPNRKIRYECIIYGTGWSTKDIAGKFSCFNALFCNFGSIIQETKQLPQWNNLGWDCDKDLWMDFNVFATFNAAESHIKKIKSTQESSKEKNPKYVDNFVLWMESLNLMSLVKDYFKSFSFKGHLI